jgi:lipopolysaccharide biosynthesis glycosyltransferase
VPDRRIQATEESGCRSNDSEEVAVPAATPRADIVCAADEKYALPLAVMLESLLTHAARGVDVALHIIDCGLSSRSRGRIESMADERARILWLLSRRSPSLSSPSWGHVTGATYERLLLAEYLPATVTRALWLDCDLLVLDDVTPLLQGPMGGAALRAVRDPFVPRVSAPFGVRDWRRLGLARDAPYFNAGVMLIDLPRWHSMDIACRALDYLQTYGRKVWFNEQEALNAVIGDGWSPLDDRWNLAANPFHARKQRPDGSPAIVHFAGRVKPWEVPGLGATQSLYFHHLDKTPWRGFRPPETAAGRLLSWYLGSNLRPLTYWLENQHLRLRHFLGY